MKLAIVGAGRLEAVGAGPMQWDRPGVEDAACPSKIFEVHE